MTAVDPTKLATVISTSGTSADTSESLNWTACGTDDNTGTTCDRVQGNSSERVRMEFDGISGVAVGDTITFYTRMVRNGTTYALYAYTGATTVTATGKITGSWPGNDSSAVITLTQALIDELADLGGGTWAVRLTEDGAGSSDVEFTEVDADITAGGDAGLSIPVAMAGYRRRHEMRN